MRKHHKSRFEGLGFVHLFENESGEAANAGCSI